MHGLQAGHACARLGSAMHARSRRCIATCIPAMHLVKQIRVRTQELPAAHLTHGCTAAILQMPRDPGAVPSASSALSRVLVRADVPSIMCLHQYVLADATCASPESQDEFAYDGPARACSWLKSAST